MKVLKYVLIFILIVLIAGAIFVAVQPGTYDISRSRTINAPQKVVNNYITDYTRWPDWSPWLQQEPDAVITYGDKTSGVDASYSWKGEKLGEGSMETVYISKDSISQRIKFISPYESSAMVYWTTEAQENSTKVTWGMQGEMGFMEKAYAMLGGGMDNMLGPDYERGLEKLDSVIVSGMKIYSLTDNGTVSHGGGYYLYVTTSARQSEVGDKMGPMFAEIQAFTEKNNIDMAGMPFTLYHQWDEEAGTAMFSTCIPVKEKIITLEGSNVLCGYIEPHTYYKTTLKGDYANLQEAWEKSVAHLKAAGYEENQEVPPFEVYVNDPMEHPNPADWTTEIYIPVVSR